MGFGGLGLRKALHTALPAHLASLVVAAPKLADLADNLERAGLVTADLVMTEHSTTIDTAQRLFEEQLDTEAKEALSNFLEAAKPESPATGSTSSLELLLAALRLHALKNTDLEASSQENLLEQSAADYVMNPTRWAKQLQHQQCRQPMSSEN